MSILIQAGDTVKAYLAHSAEGKVPLPRECPSCGGYLHGHGWCWRQVVEVVVAVALRVRRVKCSACGDTHVCLPHFLAPRRIFTLAAIEQQVVAYVSTPQSLRRVAAAVTGEPAYQRLWGWVQRMGRQAAGSLGGLQSVLTGLDPSGDLASALPPNRLPEALADWKTRTPHTKQRFLGAWRVLVAITQLAAVAATHQVTGPQADGEYIAWANWVLSGEGCPDLLSSPQCICLAAGESRAVRSG